LKNSRRQFLLGTASLVCAPALRAQQQPQQQEDATFSADVKVVNILATVRSKKGEIIRGLTKDDFVVLEDKRPQTIRYFSKDSDLPLTIGLMVDTSMSQQKVLDAERSASFRFLEQVLREKIDQVFIVQFDMAVRMSQDLTSARQKLEHALESVDVPSRSELAMQNGGGTLLYDAVIKASADVMKNQKNRKALILLTDGVDTGSDQSLPTSIEAAQRADTLVYSILFSDSGAYGMPFGFAGPDGKGVLTRLSRETGGGFFEVSKKLGIDQIYSVIQDELRSQYSIGFVSDTPVRVSEFRTLQLTTKQKGLVVQARDRYWAAR
jgi:VWFA-related protein